MQNQSPHTKGFGPVISRLTDVMSHVSLYSGKNGSPLLAKDAGLDRTTITRLLKSELNPSFALVVRITVAIETALGFRIDPREIFAEWGNYLTPHICEALRCRGCLPDSALNEFGQLQPAFAQIESGTWVSSKYPRGYLTEKGGL